MADYGHLPALATDEGFVLAALYDPLPGRAASVATRFACPVATADAEAFYRTPMDAVVVAAPLGAHREHVLRAAREGLHVLCEKPIAETPEHAREMASAMEGAGRILAVGHVYRHSPVTRQLLEWIASGRLGRIGLVRMSYLWSLHGRYETLADGTWGESPRWRGRMLEGGPMIDCGVHFIDLARLFAGEIVGAQGSGAWLADYEAPDYVLGSFAHAGGARSVIDLGFTYGHTAADPAYLFTYDLVGTGGTARYDRDGWRLEIRDGDGTEVVPGGSEKDFAAMYRAFAGAIRTGDLGPLASASDAATALDWAVRVTESSRAGRILPNL